METRKLFCAMPHVPAGAKSGRGVPPNGQKLLFCAMHRPRRGEIREGGAPEWSNSVAILAQVIWSKNSHPNFCTFVDKGSVPESSLVAFYFPHCARQGGTRPSAALPFRVPQPSSRARLALGLVPTCRAD